MLGVVLLAGVFGALLVKVKKLRLWLLGGVGLVATIIGVAVANDANEAREAQARQERERTRQIGAISRVVLSGVEWSLIENPYFPAIQFRAIARNGSSTTVKSYHVHLTVLDCSRKTDCATAWDGWILNPPPIAAGEARVIEETVGTSRLLKPRGQFRLQWELVAVSPEG